MTVMGVQERIVVTAATPAVEVGPTLVRTIANLAFDRKEETSPFAGGQFARNGFLCKVDEVLGILEDAKYSDAFFTGDDCDPRSIRTENRTSQEKSPSCLTLAGKFRYLAPRLGGPEPNSAILERSCHDVLTARTELGAGYTAAVPPKNGLLRSAGNAPDSHGAIA